MISEPIESETVEIDVFDGVASSNIALTNLGSIEIGFSEDVEITPTDEFKTRFTGNEVGETKTFTGRTSKGISVEFSESIVEPMMKLPESYYVKGISPATVFFDSSDGEPIVNKEVTVEIDLMNFAPRHPYRGGMEQEPILERKGFTLTASTLSDLEDRVEYIKDIRRPIYTGSIQVIQQVNGPLERQLNSAIDKVFEVLELLSFLQGVFPSPIRTEVVKIDGKEPNYTCKRWEPVYPKSIGHAFKGQKFTWGRNAFDFIDEVYDKYVNILGEKYRVHLALQWYLDSLIENRSLESKFASICSGIELMAKRHSDLGPEYSKTEDKIVHLVNELDIDVRDLAEFSDNYADSKLDDVDCANEYFYHRTRQYVMHGDNLGTSSDELYRDYIASQKLFQRLLRNQLIGTENHDEYSGLNELDVRDTRYT